jgi:threonine dehydrogenase-like Zn-dependent dehydrogenase
MAAGVPLEMLAAVFRDGAHFISTVAVPLPRPDEVLIRIARSGICASDLKAADLAGRASEGGGTAAQLYGHEISGTIVRLGEEVRGLRTGDRVTAMAISGCGTCSYCRQGEVRWCRSKRNELGGYAQFAVRHWTSCVRLPAAVDDVTGVLSEPLASALHGIDMIDLAADPRVLVIGAGTIGLASAWFARRRGISRLVLAAPSRRRVVQAAKLGIDQFLQVDDDLAAGASVLLGGAPEVVIEASGGPGMLQLALDCAGPRATVVIPGVSYGTEQVKPMVGLMKELVLRFSRAYGLADFEGCLAQLCEAELDAGAFISLTVSLNEFPAAFEDLRASRTIGKVLLDPWRVD